MSLREDLAKGRALIDTEAFSELLEELRAASRSPQIATPLADLFGDAFDTLTELASVVDDLAAERKRTAQMRPFWPRVSRLNPAIYNGDRWVIDGRSSERYTPKTWRMVVHYLLAVVFG